MVTPRPGRPEASAVIWHQIHELSDLDTASRARVRGAVQAAAGGAIGGALILLSDLRTLPYVMLGAAGFIFLSSMLSPKGLFAALEHMLGAVAGRLGRAIMWVSLVTVFCAFFVPFGALFRSGRRDTLKRFLEPDAESYWNWEPSEGATSATQSLESQY